MKNNLKTVEGLKLTINDLIKAGTSFDINVLDVIYHKDLKIIMLSNKSDKIIADKEAFKNVFKEKLKNGDESLNTWANFIHLAVDDNKGHVIVTRKVNLTGVEKEMVVNIDLIWENNKWQVIREVITD